MMHVPCAHVPVSHTPSASLVEAQHSCLSQACRTIDFGITDVAKEKTWIEHVHATIY